LIFNKEFKKSDLVVQYQPHVAVLNGKVAVNYLNQAANLDTYFVLTPHWTMGVFDHVTYLKNDGLAGTVFSDADAATATSIQNTFFDNAATWLFNSVGAGFTYAFSGRTILTISPNVAYSRTSGLAVANSQRSSLDYATSLELRHIVSARTSFVGNYTNKLSQFNGLTPNTTFNTLEIGAYHQFTPTISVNILGGGTQTNQAGRQKLWTATGSVSVFKTFVRGSASLAYSRGDTLSGFVTNHLGDRIDLLGRYRVTRRLGANAGIGYDRELESELHISGKYVTGEVNYALTPTVSLFSDYVYKIQRGNSVQLFSGNRSFSSFGIRWDPTAIRHQ
jgi:hypothetical protein